MTHTRAPIVTGGGRGIGRAIALALTRDGRSVAVADLLGDEARAVAAEITNDGGSSIAVELDVTDWAPRPCSSAQPTASSPRAALVRAPKA